MQKLKNVFLLSAVLSSLAAYASGDVLIESDFSKDSLETQGWKIDGGWDITDYNAPSNNPGKVLRFKADLPDGTLTHSFDAVNDPQKLVLTVTAGWGWGAADQAADAINFMLLDDKGDGYVFITRRVNADWALQWARVRDHKMPESPANWASEKIDGTLASIKDGGGLNTLTITRSKGGNWTFAGKTWDKGAGGSDDFIDNTKTSFSQIVLIGTKNIDDQVFGKVSLTIEK